MWDIGAERSCKASLNALSSEESRAAAVTPKSEANEVKAQSAAGYPARNSRYCGNIRN
jgi:hypothetical protein